MGNHEVGRAMGRMAELALKMRTNQTALALLDEICEPYRGSDAEFEAVDPQNPHRTHPDYFRYTDPNGPLGVLIQESFGPTVDWKTLLRDAIKSGDDDKMEAFWESWSDGPEGACTQTPTCTKTPKPAQKLTAKQSSLRSPLQDKPLKPP